MKTLPCDFVEVFLSQYVKGVHIYCDDYRYSLLCVTAPTAHEYKFHFIMTGSPRLTLAVPLEVARHWSES
jgi:hypothetical protein